MNKIQQMILLDINDSTILVVFLLFFALTILPALIIFRLLENWRCNKLLKAIITIAVSIIIVFSILHLMYKVTGKGLLQ